MIVPKHISEPAPGILELTIDCWECHQPTKLVVSAQGYDEWRNGGHIQDVFPSMPAAQREMLISGTCGKCWDELFPPEEEGV